jgi:phage terminase Nu1 subunit (DNA packaging protein)
LFSAIPREMKKKKKEKEKSRIVSIKEIAVILNLTRSRIQQLVQEGLPKKLRGKYDQDECTGWYIRYLQALVEKKAIVDEGGKVFASEREERLRLLRADADLREIELARERSELVSIDEVEREMTDLILTTKARIMAVGPRLAPELVGETSRIMAHAKIEKALKDALLNLSERQVRTRETGE